MAAETSAESIAIDVNVSIGGAGETASRFTIAVNPTGATRRDLHRAVAEELRLTRLQRGYLRLVVPNEPKMNAPATPRELARLLAVEEPVRSEEVLGDRLVPGCWIYGACNVAYGAWFSVSRDPSRGTNSLLGPASCVLGQSIDWQPPGSPYRLYICHPQRRGGPRCYKRDPGGFVEGMGGTGAVHSWGHHRLPPLGNEHGHWRTMDPVIIGARPT
ncbi:hypothetical protein DFJ74DRAFT_652324 [Hyaloraphidium curvatum]|nr:hypothetical protein DFJ74DRAFT_652324 [Hyaloraphidium curvatum]